MVRLAAEIKRGFLNSLARQASGTTPPTTLIAALGAFQDGGFASCQSGRLIVSHAGAGKTTVFQVPAIGKQFTQEDVFALSQELLEAYADALTTLAITQPTDTSQDASILATMMADDRLQGYDYVTKDFSSIGWPYR